MTTAFDPIDLAGLRLANRIALAPMTRNRAGEGNVPTAGNAEYYAQRASGGLLISEAVQPSAVGQGYPATPGLHTAEQVAGWRQVTDAVHAAGGRIFAQINHVGRIGHRSLLPEGLVNVAPSALAAPGQVFTTAGMQDFETPRELTAAEVRATVGDYVSAARNAVEAGFDGVELHGANGYLIHQFLAAGTNLRTDEWGGTAENRNRFALEIARAVAHEIGAGRTGIRLSPANPYNGIEEPDAEGQYTALVKEFDALGLAYLHVMESSGQSRELTRTLRELFSGVFILNPFSGDTFTGPEAIGLIEDGTADLVAFGRLFLANPDLPARLKAQGPYNTPDSCAYYGGTEQGYTDYPAL